ncbi:MAG TPA: phospholipase D-like domain-containing protein [Candidatus Methanofastidiosa archaeon]|nr:phospholipase D-like domain-containing protein [Candidatus Methanofastidiosa archaeon]
MQIKWLGGAGEVGRSCIYLKDNNFRCLLDCGVKLSSDDMYPDLSDINFSKLNAVIVSHAHLDHCGYVPFLFAHGYRGPVYTTHPTRRISRIMQDDFASIQKDEAGWGPYWRDDVRLTKKHTISLDYGEKKEIGHNIFLTFHNAGHILGSAQTLIETPYHSLLYSGDINMDVNRIMDKADTNIQTDSLIIESTYGARNDKHSLLEDSERELIELINNTLSNGGKVIIPVFAIGRAQNILVTLKRAFEDGKLNVPIYLDGMLQKINEIYDDYPEWMNSEMYSMFKDSNPFDCPMFINVHDRGNVIASKDPVVVVTTAGMMSGGPVISYFKAWGNDPRNALILVGYQVEGTLRRSLLDGEREITLDGKKLFVNAQVHSTSFSAHADHDGLLEYVSSLKKRPKNIFLNHGDPAKLKELAEDLGENAIIAEQMVTYTLEAARTGFEPIEPSFSKEDIEMVITTPRDEIIKNYMIQIIRSTRKELRISGYIDTALTNEIIEAMRRNVKVKAMIRHLTRPSNKEAYKLLASHGAEIKENRDLHARMVISDDRYALISSADLTRDSFYDHYEAGFLVKDKAMVNKVLSFFQRIWGESYEVG